MRRDRAAEVPCVHVFVCRGARNRIQTHDKQGRRVVPQRCTHQHKHRPCLVTHQGKARVVPISSLSGRKKTCKTRIISLTVDEREVWVGRQGREDTFPLSLRAAAMFAGVGRCVWLSTAAASELKLEEGNASQQRSRGLKGREEEKEGGGGAALLPAEPV